jgi:hypothetical protein
MVQATKTETLVREYKSTKAYAKDAPTLAQQGWQPVNTIEKRGGGPRWIPILLRLVAALLPGVVALLFWRRRRVRFLLGLARRRGGPRRSVVLLRLLTTLVSAALAVVFWRKRIVVVTYTRTLS